MKPEYADWVADYSKRHDGALLGQCEDAVKRMVEAFPELTIVRGHVFVMRWGQRAHWWCVAPDESVVDPTAKQFPMILAYEPWIPGTPVRVGKCMNCGDEIYRVVQSLDEPAPRVYSCGPRCAAELSYEFNG